MGRFRIYAHNDIPDGILENIKSDQFITSTSVTLSPSRHILWEVMFGGFTVNLFAQNERIIVTPLDIALQCLEHFAGLNPNPFASNSISRNDLIDITKSFALRINAFNDVYLAYNITEVFNTYDVAKTETEMITASAASKDFYTKILTKQPFTFREALYALSGTPFKCGGLTNSELISCVIENPSKDDLKNMLTGVDDM
jgi:hypothetical protein